MLDNVVFLCVDLLSSVSVGNRSKYKRVGAKQGAENGGDSGIFRVPGDAELFPQPRRPEVRSQRLRHSPSPPDKQHNKTLLKKRDGPGGKINLSRTLVSPRLRSSDDQSSGQTHKSSQI